MLNNEESIEKVMNFSEKSINKDKDKLTDKYNVKKKFKRINKI